MKDTLTWLPRILWFHLWYLKELVVANVGVIKDTLSPGQNSEPGIVVARTRCTTEFEITLLSSLISLTPGTLTLGTRLVAATDDDAAHRVLYVHFMYHPDPEDARAAVADMEEHMLTAVRRKGVTS